MFTSIATTYLALKFVFLFSLVRIQVKAEPMKEHWLFLGFLFTAGVAFLSYVFLISWQSPTWAPWQVRFAHTLGISPWLSWLGQTLVLSALYFKLLGTFDEGKIFWFLVLSGFLLVLY
jgi:hypothetical protein